MNAQPRTSLLHCMSPVLALFCRADRANQCPKSGGERTQHGHAARPSVTHFRHRPPSPTANRLYNRYDTR
jgi:hypothetical protein